MRKTFEFLSGLILIFASIFSMVLIRIEQIGGYLVVGEGIFSQIVVYTIAAALAILGLLYLIRSYK